jgi:hypothetical protein
MAYINYTFEDIEIKAGNFDITVCAHVKVVDDGIGPYEFWGSKGYHHDIYAYIDSYEIEEVLVIDKTENFNKNVVDKQLREWIENNKSDFEDKILENFEY